MAKKHGFNVLSNLERELELEMESVSGSEEDLGDDSSAEVDEEFESLLADDQETDESYELDEDEEFDDREREGEEEFVDRLMEIAGREFESESEVDEALNEVLGDVEREYFFGSLISGAKKRLKKGIGALAKKKLLRGLAKKGWSLASGRFPALKAAVNLARGDLRGTLMNVAKQALASAVPGGTATLGALRALGFDPGGIATNREGWGNYVQISREAYEHLADNLTASADQPREANRLASAAMQYALQRAETRAAGSPRQASGRQGKVRVVVLAPGERLVVKQRG